MISNKDPVSLISGIFVSTFVGAIALFIWAWLVATHAIRVVQSALIFIPALLLFEYFLISRAIRRSRLPEASVVKFPNAKRLWRLPIL